MGEPLLDWNRDGPAEPKVGDLELTVEPEQDVRRLEIAVHDPAALRADRREGRWRESRVVDPTCRGGGGARRRGGGRLNDAKARGMAR